MQFSVEAIERLELVGRLCAAPTDFKVSDLVKPRPFTPISLTGPCVVIELLAAPIRYLPKDQDIEGYLFDMRVAYDCGAGHIHSLLVERWMFEPYSGLVMFGDTATAKPPAGNII